MQRCHDQSLSLSAIKPSQEESSTSDSHSSGIASPAGVCSSPMSTNLLKRKHLKSRAGASSESVDAIFVFVCSSKCQVLANSSLLTTECPQHIFKEMIWKCAAANSSHVWIIPGEILNRSPKTETTSDTKGPSSQEAPIPVCRD